MDTTVAILVVVLVVLVIAGIGFWLYSQQQKSRRLREGFGPEYEQTVAERGSKREAEKELEQRQKRIEKLHLRELEPEERRRFADEWRQVQARFVDDPPAAIEEADHLIGRVMEAKGYPVKDFEQRASDLSVDHPEFVRNYRAAHSIADMNERDEASTEDLRQAMVHYRALFEDILEKDTVRTDGGKKQR
jgi:hypothetical protein